MVMLERIKQSAWAAWAPSGCGAAMLMASSVYFFASQGSAARKIKDLEQFSRRAGEQALQAEATALSSGEIASLKEREADLQQRLADASEPGLVVPELSESARKAGLRLREIRGGPKKGGANGEAGPPTYQVSVSGSYRRIAEYMHLCKEQRIPARVTSFRLSRPAAEEPAEPTGQAEAELEAEITVEAFVPRGAGSAAAAG